MTTEHTATPWKIAPENEFPWSGNDGYNGASTFTILADNAVDGLYGILSTPLDNLAKKADGEFIVRACNAHDDLVKALQSLVDCISETRGKDSYDALLSAHKALAKAQA